MKPMGWEPGEGAPATWLLCTLCGPCPRLFSGWLVCGTGTPPGPLVFPGCHQGPLVHKVPPTPSLAPHCPHSCPCPPGGNGCPCPCPQPCRATTSEAPSGLPVQYPWAPPRAAGCWVALGSRGHGWPWSPSGGGAGWPGRLPPTRFM